MKVTRREVLRLTAGAGMLPMSAWVAACGDDSQTIVRGPSNLFNHNVASGDPLADAVILWTRVSPDGPGEVRVDWEIAADPDFRQVVGGGAVMTDESLDYTVKVDATGLRDATTYYYRFHAQLRTSPIGRTRTAPAGAADRLRFAVASCSKYSEGYFVAYRAIARRQDIDAVIHLGDYIYETGDRGPVRPHDPPHEIVEIEDYRARYAQYRSDPDLQEAHRQHPFINVWDDHESTNNSWRDGASNHTEGPEGEGSWVERKARAQRVYSEWMPIRVGSPDRIFRKLSYGDLLDIIMLDTRLWGRDEPVDRLDVEAVFDPERSLLGFDQEEWLADRLIESTAQWKILGQQVILSQWKLSAEPNSQGGGQVANSDGWDGYDATRQRFYEVLRENDIANVVVLTGDVHSSWAFEFTEDPNNPDTYDRETGEGSLGVEFVAPGVTNTFFGGIPPQVFTGPNPHTKYGETTQRGYLVLDITAERTQSAWFHFDSVAAVDDEEHFAVALSTADGESHLVEDDAPADPIAPAPEFAPEFAPDTE